MLAEDVAPLRAMARSTAQQNVAAMHASFGAAAAPPTADAAAVAEARAGLDQARAAARRRFEDTAPGHPKKQALLDLMVARFTLHEFDRVFNSSLAAAWEISLSTATPADRMRAEQAVAAAIAQVSSTSPTNNAQTAGADSGRNLAGFGGGAALVQVKHEQDDAAPSPPPYAPNLAAAPEATVGSGAGAGAGAAAESTVPPALTASEALLRDPVRIRQLHQQLQKQRRQCRRAYDAAVAAAAAASPVAMAAKQGLIDSRLALQAFKNACDAAAIAAALHVGMKGSSGGD